MTPLVIPLQNNTRWGTVDSMLGWSYQLHQVWHDIIIGMWITKAINLFLNSADELFRLITTICHQGYPIKKYCGQHSSSTQMIGNMSMTSTSLSVMLTSFNTIFLMKKSWVSGTQSPHLKNFKWLGKWNAILQDSELITLLSMKGWRSLENTIGSLMTSQCLSFHLGTCHNCRVHICPL